MGARLIFKVNVGTSENAKCVGYLYDHWGEDNGEWYAENFQDAMAEINGDPENPCDVVKALIKVAELDGSEAVIETPDNCNDHDDDLDKLFGDNAKLIADNPELAAHVYPGKTEAYKMYVGTGDGYPDYIYGWCEDAYELTYKPGSGWTTGCDC